MSQSYNPFYNIENPQLMGYEYAWSSFMRGQGLNNAIISQEIGQSRERCRNGRIQMNFKGNTSNTPGEAPNTQETFLKQTGGKMIADILEAWDNDCFYGIITDAHGKKLFGMSNTHRNFSKKLEKVGEIEDFSEGCAGTNCFSLVSETCRPFATAGAQHYFECFHGLAGYAAPIFSANYQMIGMVGFYTIAERMDEYILSFAVAVERAIENSLRWFRSQALVEKETEEKQLILDTVSDGVVYVSDSGRITHNNRKLTELLRMKNDSLIGKDISFIITSPPVEELKKYPFSSQYSKCDNKVSINNTLGESCQCFFNKYQIAEHEADRNSEIWVFTIYSDIKKLAKKLYTGNTSRYTFQDIKSRSESMRMVIELAKKASSFQVSTIIEGESGSGKEMLAQAIHSEGPRKAGPFIAVDCGALPSGLLESELFGYEEGAYTGARRGGKQGKFEMANKGVLFLDEITNMPLDMQAKLLRVLQERQAVRIGGSDPIAFDVQVIAATNKDIISEIERKNFRLDLFYRLNIIHIKIPALKERKDDIDLFIRYFMNKFNPKGDMRIHPDAIQILRKYDWPGNVRQLENVIERMVIIADTRIIGRECIPDEILKSVGEPVGISVDLNRDETLEDLCRLYVYKTVERYGGNIRRAADALGISRATVYKYLKTMGKPD